MKRLKISELRRKCKEAGIDEVAIDNAGDDERPKLALSRLLRAQQNIATHKNEQWWNKWDSFEPSFEQIDEDNMVHLENWDMPSDWDNMCHYGDNVANNVVICEISDHGEDEDEDLWGDLTEDDLESAMYLVRCKSSNAWLCACHLCGKRTLRCPKMSCLFCSLHKQHARVERYKLGATH